MHPQALTSDDKKATQLLSSNNKDRGCGVMGDLLNCNSV